MSFSDLAKRGFELRFLFPFRWKEGAIQTGKAHLFLLRDFMEILGYIPPFINAVAVYGQWNGTNLPYVAPILVLSIHHWGNTVVHTSQRKQIIRTRLPLGRFGSDYIALVPAVGLEPTRYRYQRILSPSRLPFHHTGKHHEVYHNFFFMAIPGVDFFRKAAV